MPDLVQNFDRPSPALGEISLVDQHGVALHLVRGNTYLSLNLHSATPGNVPSEGSEPIRLQPIAQRLDQYLSARTLPPGEHRKPALLIGGPVSRTVHVGDVFTLDAGGDTFAAVDGESSDSTIVIAGGLQSDSQKFEFYAATPGKAELKLHVAHKETLVPATETFAITVELA